MRRIAPFVVTVAALAGCGSTSTPDTGTSYETALSSTSTALPATEHATPTLAPETCALRISNPALPSLYNDIQFTGPGAQAQCDGARQAAPTGASVMPAAVVDGNEACSVQWHELTITVYSNDPQSAQSGCAWARQRADGS